MADKVPFARMESKWEVTFTWTNLPDIVGEKPAVIFVFHVFISRF